MNQWVLSISSVTMHYLGLLELCSPKILEIYVRAIGHLQKGSQYIELNSMSLKSRQKCFARVQKTGLE